MKYLFPLLLPLSAGAGNVAVAPSLPSAVVPTLTVSAIPAAVPAVSLPAIALPAVALPALQTGVSEINAAQNAGGTPDRAVQRLYAEEPGKGEAPQLPSEPVVPNEPSARPSNPAPLEPAPESPKKKDDPEASAMARAAKVPSILGTALFAVAGGAIGYHGGPVAALLGSSVGVIGAIAGLVFGAIAGWKLGWGGPNKKDLPKAIGYAIIGLIAGAAIGGLGGTALGAYAGHAGGPFGATVGVIAAAPIGSILGAIAGAVLDVYRNPEKYPNLRKEIKK